MSGADQMPPSQLSRPEFLTAWLRRERYIDRPGAYRIRKISRKASMIMQALTVSDDGSSRGAIESGPRRRIGAQGLMFRTCGREPFEQKAPNRWSHFCLLYPLSQQDLCPRRFLFQEMISVPRPHLKNNALC